MLKRVRVWWTLTALVLAFVVAAAACDNGGDGADDEDALTPAASPTEAGTPAVSGEIITFEDVLKKDPNVTKRAEVEWGWMFEQSGVMKDFGEPTGDGVLMAVEEINEAGGFQVGDTIYTIKLIKHDTRSSTENTVAVARELVRDDQVKIIWGPATTGDPESTLITQQAQVLHICPCPDRELGSLTSVERVQSEFPWAFETIAGPSRFLPTGARNNAEEYDFETFATICVNTEAGRQWCDLFRDAYESAGFEHVGRELTPEGETDFSPFLTNLREADPDMILSFVDPTAQFGLLRQSWEMDVGEFYIAAVVVPYDLFEALVGEGIRDKIVSAGGTPRIALENHYTSEEVRLFFEEKYKAFKGGDLPIAAFGVLLTYDPVYMLVAAMQQAGTVEDTTKIAAALEQIHFDGVGEDDLYFDKSHIIIAGNDACTITGGAYTECVHVPAVTEGFE